jgi:hypothetical protein
MAGLLRRYGPPLALVLAVVGVINSANLWDAYTKQVAVNQARQEYPAVESSAVVSVRTGTCATFAPAFSFGVACGSEAANDAAAVAVQFGPPFNCGRLPSPEDCNDATLVMVILDSRSHRRLRVVQTDPTHVTSSP